MFMLFKKKAVYTFTPNLWLRQKTFGRQNVFLCLWNSFPYARKKSRFQAKNKHVCGVEVLRGIFLSNTWPTPTFRHLPPIPLVIWILHKLWGQQDCLCYCKQFSDICCCWKVLAMTKSLFHSFSHCLQWSRVHCPLLGQLLGKQLFGFLPKKFGFWVVLHLWNHQRLDNTYLSISLLLLETLVIQAVWLLSPLPLVPVYFAEH